MFNKLNSIQSQEFDIQFTANINTLIIQQFNNLPGLRTLKDIKTASAFK